MSRWNVHILSSFEGGLEQQVSLFRLVVEVVVCALTLDVNCVIAF